MTQIITLIQANTGTALMHLPLGDDAPRYSGGATWETIARPRRKSLTNFQGEEPYVCTMKVMLNAVGDLVAVAVRCNPAAPLVPWTQQPPAGLQPTSSPQQPDRRAEPVGRPSTFSGRPVCGRTLQSTGSGTAGSGCEIRVGRRIGEPLR